MNHSPYKLVVVRTTILRVHSNFSDDDDNDNDDDDDDEVTFVPGNSFFQ